MKLTKWTIPALLALLIPAGAVAQTFHVGDTVNFRSALFCHKLEHVESLVEAQRKGWDEFMAFFMVRAQTPGANGSAQCAVVSATFLLGDVMSVHEALPFPDGEHDVSIIAVAYPRSDSGEMGFGFIATDAKVEPADEGDPA